MRAIPPICDGRNGANPSGNTIGEGGGARNGLKVGTTRRRPLINPLALRPAIPPAPAGGISCHTVERE